MARACTCMCHVACVIVFCVSSVSVCLCLCVHASVPHVSVLIHPISDLFDELGLHWLNMQLMWVVTLRK